LGSAEFHIYDVSDPLTPKYIQSPFYLSSLTNKNVNEFSKYTSKDFNESDDGLERKGTTHHLRGFQISHP
jgi:hypothetical protein